MLNFLKNSRFNLQEREAHRRLKNSLDLPKVDDNNPEVLIDISDSLCECVEQLAFARYFSERFNIKATTYLPGFTHKRRALYRLLGHRINFALSRGYRLGNSHGMKQGLDAGIVDAAILHAARTDLNKFLANVHAKEEVLNYEMYGVKIGIAIYDTFLRETNSATVDLQSSRFHEIAAEAFIILQSVIKYFKLHDVKVVVLGHCVYNNWKILSDYAQSRGSQVYVTYNSRLIPIHDVNVNRGLQTADHSKYKADFLSMPSELQVRGRAEGAALLARRLCGEIDPGISYMSTSPYAENPTHVAVVGDPRKKTVVIMLHSFFDSPHVYKNMVFPDFLEWVQETLDVFIKEDLFNEYEILVKPHPNRLPGEDEIISSIVSKYPFIKIIPPETSNTNIVNMRPVCILTVYGSVAAEFTYHRIPVITCGDNPASSFGFTFEAHDKKSYFQLLKKSSELVITNEQFSEIGEFMFMHYQYNQPINKKLYSFERYTRHDTRNNYERIRGFSFEEFRGQVDEYFDNLENCKISHAMPINKE